MHLPVWASALSATMVAQVTSSIAAATIPLLGPVLTARWGLPPEAIGYASAAMSAGICWCLACGTPMLNHHGPVRTLQIGLGLTMLAVVCLVQPAFAVGFVGAFLLGIGLAPNTPAGSALLMKTAPAERRNLIFSIRQAGVPAGGAIAGALLAPMLAWVGFGWSILAILGLLALGILAMQPFRARLDLERARQTGWVKAFLSPRALSRSLDVLGCHRDLPLLTMIGVSFSIAQQCVLAFTATYLVTQVGRDLSQAGQLMAVLLVSSAIARIGLGWLADRWGSGLPLLSVLLLAAALSVGLFMAAAAGPPWLLYGVVALIGATSLGWTGVYMAELARLAPPAQVGEVTSAVSLFGFAGSFGGPLAFSLIATASKSFTIAFWIVAAQLTVTGLFALRSHAGPGDAKAEAECSPR